MNSDFQIFSSIRKRLSPGARIYQVVLGVIVAWVCLRGYKPSLIPMIVAGLFMISSGIFGRQWLKALNSITIANGQMVLKRSFEWTVRKKLSDIRHITFDSPDELLIEFDGYAKTYDLSWLLPDDFVRLKAKLEEIIQ